jgi:hypothetical protein
MSEVHQRSPNLLWCVIPVSKLVKWSYRSSNLLIVSYESQIYLGRGTGPCSHAASWAGASNSASASPAPELWLALGGVGWCGGIRISADTRCSVFSRSNNAINGATEEMADVGEDLISPANGNGAAKATRMEELGRPYGGVRDLRAAPVVGVQRRHRGQTRPRRSTGPAS